MWYPTKVTTPPTSEPIAIDLAKRHLNVLHDDEDEYIATVIEDARDHVERYCSARFAAQTVEAACSDWGDLELFPVKPLRSVTTIVYTDPDGTEVTLTDTDVDVRGQAIVPKAGHWPAIRYGSSIVVTAEVGFVDLPRAVRRAMLLQIEDFYETRGSGEEAARTAFDNLLSNYRY